MTHISNFVETLSTVIFIVFNVFKGLGKWTWATGERNYLEV
jgi:hypothetical protein